MKIRLLAILFSLAICGCGVDGQLNDQTEISGLYCNESEALSVSTCLCYEFKNDGALEMIYGSNLGTRASTDGTYNLEKSAISVILKDPNNKAISEVMTLKSSTKIETSDKLKFKKMKELPDLCRVK